MNMKEQASRGQVNVKQQGKSQTAWHGWIMMANTRPRGGERKPKKEAKRDPVRAPESQLLMGKPTRPFREPKAAASKTRGCCPFLSFCMIGSQDACSSVRNSRNVQGMVPSLPYPVNVDVIQA